MYEEIYQKIGSRATVEQLAEECAELAQAALKLVRAWDWVNPTPISEEEAADKLIEEMADVMLCMYVVEDVLDGGKDEIYARVGSMVTEKEERWRRRIEAMRRNGREAASV